MGVKNIVIIGGGFAGTALAKGLERHLPDGYRLLLLSQDNFITYNPLLAEVVSASIPPAHAVAPVRQIARHTRFYMVNVTGVDFESKEIHYLGEGSGTIPYEHVVFACGTLANVDLVRGMADFGLPLKTLGDALFLRNRIMVRLEQTELNENPETRRWLMTFAIIGGGFSGVEVAGEINDLLRSSIKYYHNLTSADVRVILLHSGDCLLPELPSDLGAFARRKMEQDGIDVRLNARVERVRDNGVVLCSEGDLERVLGAGTIVNTIGTSPNPLIEALDLPRDRGRIRVAGDMSVPGLDGVWALGDCAMVPNARDARASPPTAQFADRQGKALARNIAARLAGRPTRAFSFRALGALSTIGHNKAVAKVLGLHFSGLIGFMLWRGFYLLKIPTLGRKVRLFLEWNWEMVFPQDIVYLRFVRSRRKPR